MSVTERSYFQEVADEQARKKAMFRRLYAEQQNPQRAQETRDAFPESAERLDDALARDQKIDFRVSQGEREMWDRAAQARGVTTSEFVRDVVNRAAEEALAAAYATTE